MDTWAARCISIGERVGRKDAILECGPATLTVWVVLADRLDAVLYRLLCYCQTGDGEEERCAQSFIRLDATVTARFGHGNYKRERAIFISFCYLLEILDKIRKGQPKTTRNRQDEQFPYRHKPNHWRLFDDTRPTQPLNFLRAKTVWYIM